MKIEIQKSKKTPNQTSNIKNKHQTHPRTLRTNYDSCQLLYHKAKYLASAPSFSLYALNTMIKYNTMKTEEDPQMPLEKDTGSQSDSESIELESETEIALEIDTNQESPAGTNQSSSSPIEPIELQCEEVDMDNHLMDPLEWTVRKTIPIPKQYYWETENYDVSFRTKLWHRSIQSMGMALYGAERVGGFFANFLGLNSSRFEDVTAYMSEEDWELAKKNQRVDKQKRRKHLEVKEVKNSRINII